MPSFALLFYFIAAGQESVSKSATAVIPTLSVYGFPLTGYNIVFIYNVLYGFFKKAMVG